MKRTKDESVSWKNESRSKRRGRRNSQSSQDTITTSGTEVAERMAQNSTDGMVRMRTLFAKLQTIKTVASNTDADDEEIEPVRLRDWEKQQLQEIIN